MLGTIHLDVDAGRQPTVETTDTRNLSLRLKSKSGILKSQPEERLAPRIRAAVHEASPWTNTRGRAGERRVQSECRPSPVTDQTVTCRDGDFARCDAQYEEKCVVLTCQPVRGSTLIAGSCDPMHADRVSAGQPLPHALWRSERGSISRHGDVNAIGTLQKQSA
ncbi:MAG: hypothetical protein ABI632_11355 [Pseudolysinimonas sp.]